MKCTALKQQKSSWVIHFIPEKH